MALLPIAEARNKVMKIVADCLSSNNHQVAAGSLIVQLEENDTNYALTIGSKNKRTMAAIDWLLTNSPGSFRDDISKITDGE